MPTVAERLATLEAVRGRLHTIESTVRAMVLRKTFGMGMAKGWKSVALLLCAVGTAVAAWYPLLVR